jgi:hypothetical protein
LYVFRTASRPSAAASAREVVARVVDLVEARALEVRAVGVDRAATQASFT